MFKQVCGDLSILAESFVKFLHKMIITIYYGYLVKRVHGNTVRS